MKTAVAALLLASTGAGACPALEIAEPWIRESPPGQAMTAAYAKLRNRGDRPLVIDGASGPDFGSAELHRSVLENGMYRMTAGVLQIGPGASAALAPGDWHLMLFRPARALKAGDQVKLALKCGQQASEAVFTVRAEAP